MIEVLSPGPLATVQDLGRHGRQSIGVPRSGAFDRAACRLANRLVGNAVGDAALELTLGGAHLVTTAAATIAITGARCPATVDWGTAVSVPAGAHIRLGTPATGLRTYLAVRGGVEVEPVLGSRSTDLLSGLGPAPLRPGDRLGVGPAPDAPVSGAFAVDRDPATPLSVWLGPRDDWFTAAARRQLVATTWSVRSESDRVGVRLDGPALERVRRDELPSEPMLPGAIQVPPDGRPILFGPDCPTTGGYPVIAVVLDADLDRAAQLRPGDPVGFRAVALT